MTGTYFILLALLTAVISFLLAKTVLKQGSSRDPVAYAVISFLLGGAYAAVFYALTSLHTGDIQALLQPQIALLVATDVGLWALGTCFFYPAYKHLPVSESTIIYSLEGLFALLFGVVLFRTDNIYMSRLIGSALIITSVVLASQKKSTWRLDKFTWILILSTVIFGLATVFDNLIVSRHYFSSVAFFMILNFAGVGLATLLLRPKTIGKLHTIYKDKRAMLTVLATSFTTFLAFFFVYKGYQLHIAASQSNMILSSQTVIIVILGALLFKERDHVPKKLLAGVIAAIGVYLIA